jgi:hypothetical protein
MLRKDWVSVKLCQFSGVPKENGLDGSQSGESPCSIERNVSYRNAACLRIRNWHRTTIGFFWGKHCPNSLAALKWSTSRTRRRAKNNFSAMNLFFYFGGGYLLGLIVVCWGVVVSCCCFSILRLERRLVMSFEIVFMVGAIFDLALSFDAFLSCKTTFCASVITARTLLSLKMPSSYNILNPPKKKLPLQV